MSAVCHTNPLQQFVNKNDQFKHAGLTQANNSTVGTAAPSHSLESQFLNSRDNQNNFMNVQKPYVGRNISQQDSWLNQFSSMKVEDPLEFGKEYKNLYKGYESRMGQGQNSHPAMNQSFVPRTMYSPANLMTQQMTKSISVTTENNRSNDSYFDNAFDSLERELQEELQESLVQDNSLEEPQFSLDHEQLKFQQAAKDIYVCLSNTSSASSTSAEVSASVSNKLSRSKFMGLMRRISDGDVTVKKNDEESNGYTELFSPTTGETIGNEYFPVMDKTQDQQYEIQDPLALVDDLSGLSSTDAAKKVLRS